MNTPLATVLVPTHEHGPLLTFAVRSALAQTVDAIEVFIVCDGPDPDTLLAATELGETDSRVRVFVNEKGPRHGEVHRHRALAEATGAIVCYLSDDDLWLPHHVATMARLLEAADFADAQALNVRPDGRILMWPGHLSVEEVRRAMFEGYNFIPLSAGAHTLELYRRLPHGWRTSPDGVFTDLYMWQQILSVDGLRFASGEEPTVLHFASPLRVEMSLSERIAEMERWLESMSVPGFESDLVRRAQTDSRIAWARGHMRTRRLERQATATDARLADLEQQLADAGEQLQRSTAERDELIARLEAKAAHLEAKAAHLEASLARVEANMAHVEAQLDWITESRTWRARQAVLRAPGMAWLLRTVGVARSR